MLLFPVRIREVQEVYVKITHYKEIKKMKKMLTALLALLFLVLILTACSQATEQRGATAPDQAETIEAVVPELEYDSESELEAENSLSDINSSTEHGVSTTSDLNIFGAAENNEPVYVPEPEFGIESTFPDDNKHGLNISIASEELLGAFSYLHEVDYTIQVEHSNVDKLVIWANTPLYDFALTSIENDVIDDRTVFIPTDTFGQVEELLPGQAFVINSYVQGGTWPRSGISFATESGERHYFSMRIDESVSIEPNPFNDPDFLDLFVDGSLQITVTRDGLESHYFVVTLDEIGDADAVDWFTENRHRWMRFSLREFEPPAN